jgi:hypothetical protein
VVERSHISMLVDEFHTIPGADYESVLSELAKYGANLVLATQSLTRLLESGGESGRGLRATIFANIDGLFVFNCSAEDAEYLVPELGGAIDLQDLVELPEHQCYVRMSSSGRRLPTFSVKLDPPPRGDPEMTEALARWSAERYGRDAELVEADLRAAVARMELANETTAASARADNATTRHQAQAGDQPETGQPAAAAATATAPQPRVERRRNENRPRKKPRVTSTRFSETLTASTSVTEQGVASCHEGVASSHV